jgi:hypothetical protein
MAMATITSTTTPIAPRRMSFTVDAVLFGIGVGDIHICVDVAAESDAAEPVCIWLVLAELWFVEALAVKTPFPPWLYDTIEEPDNDTDEELLAAVTFVAGVGVTVGVGVTGAWTPKYT